MKVLIFLALLGFQGAAAVTHSMKYFYTASSQVPNFPEFVAVGMVDEVQMYYCNSKTRRAEIKQDWMNKVTADDPQYWETQSSVCLSTQHVFKVSTETLKQCFNQTGGVHIYQEMYGCEWDDETGEVTGYYQYSYDGEDFISFDLKTETFIAPTSQALITKNKWDRNKGYMAQQKNYLTQICPDWLKKYVNYGKSSLLRTVPPSVSLLQKTPSSPVSCHATGFYPDRASMSWRKDGEEIHEDVDHGEILPNHDGSFQIRVDLNISSVKPEDWSRYDCVFQFSGVKKDVITKLDKAEIRTNWEAMGMMIYIIIIIIIIIAVVVLLVLNGVNGFIIYRNENGEKKTDGDQTGKNKRMVY
ncbi:major histocompatibility complex class I-related gene protein-like isoform X2 [Anabas testudineus]|uniref:major histocompatibility complex class I-related gene protein-like isoform X2 n=1 Tax=Anabas testudineus TaxID=64144 RepID=UPI000E4541E5|nr:major histocompatibility complex class I-related gene protein-like isoform X2 [Anabas testudineus]